MPLHNTRAHTFALFPEILRVTLGIEFLFIFYLSWFPLLSQKYFVLLPALIFHPCSQESDFYPSLQEFDQVTQGYRPSRFCYLVSYSRCTELPCWRATVLLLIKFATFEFSTYIFVSLPIGKVHNLHPWRGKLKN